MSDVSHTTNSVNRSSLPALVYRGEVIHERHEMLSLTDMWKAAGSPENREPYNWSRKEGASFVQAVALAHNLTEGQVMKTKRGKGGGSFAHWQAALAYAKYLDHDFHMWCNTVVRERMEGRLVVPAIDMNAIGGMVKGILAKQLTEMVPSLVAAEIATHTIAIRRGKTAGQIWKEAGFPPVRVTCWFGNRLAAMGCAIDGGGYGELGLTRARLFDPDKASAWLKNGGRLMVETKIAERRGQGVLRLVLPSAQPAL